MKTGWALWTLFLQLTLIYSKNSCTNTLGNSYQSTNRHYCIMSAEIYWNYAPNSTSNRMDLTNMFESNAESILIQSELSMGSTFLKAIYQEYQYDTTTKSCDWTTLKTTTSPQSNGILGPTIRAIVGDQIYVHYFNACSRPYSIEPHGLYHSQNFNDIVQANEETTYTWLAMEASGPATNDFSSRVWMYHGGNQNDLHSGLVGAIVIVSPHYIATTNQRKNAFPCDIDFEFILGMMSFDETASWYFADNMRSKYGNQLSDDDINQYTSNSVWISANTRHTINGFMFGNINEYNGLSLSFNSLVRWNIISMASTNTAITTDEVSWEQNTVEDTSGHNTDYCTVSSPGYGSVNMKPITSSSSSGVSSFLFYNTDYEKQSSGMIGRYAVIEDGYKSNIGEDNSPSSNLEMNQRTYSFFVVIIVLSVVAVLTLFYYSISPSSFRYLFPYDSFGGGSSSMRSDMSPILWDSSHHMMPPLSSAKNLNNNSSPSSLPLDSGVSTNHSTSESNQSLSASPSSSPGKGNGNSAAANGSSPKSSTGSQPAKVVMHVKHAEI